MKKTVLVMGLLILLFPYPLWAATEISPMVVTATMSEKTLEEAPGSVQVITAAEIEEIGAATVNEVLEQAVGMMVSTDSGRAQVANIRGTGSKRSLVLIDGRRLASGYKDFTSTDQIPVAMIQRIEIVRGPSSAIYGSDAIGGVVNIITRKAPDQASGGLTLRYKSHLDKDSDGGMGSVWVGSKYGKTSFILSGSAQSISGWDDDGASPDDGDDKTLNSAAGRVCYALTDKSNLTAGFEYFDLDREGERTYLEKKIEKSREREAEDQRVNYFLQYDNQITQDGNLMVRAYRSEHENEMEFTPTASVTGEEDAERWLNQYEARYTGTIMQQHLLSVGAEFREEGREDTTGADNDLDNTSVFVQDEFHIFSPLYITAGVRFDDHSEFGSQLSPKASVIYSILDDLRFKASIGKGFRAPTISELFVNSKRSKGTKIYYANPDLEPEESLSYEIGLEGEKGPFSGGITAFRNDIDNMIEEQFQQKTSGVSYYQYQNVSEAVTQGVEAKADIALPWNLSAGASITWLDTENEETGEELEGNPDIKGILKLTYYHPDYKFRVTTRVNYIGEQYVAEAEDKSDYVTVNLYVAKDFANQIRVFAGIDNLFNETKASDGLTWVEPASAYAGCSIQF